jgi:uncharacterized protein involved in outer membrane biogenesis
MVLMAVLFLLAAALAGAWWGAPQVLRQQIEQRGSQALGRAVGLQHLELGLFPLRVTLQGLVVQAQAPAAADRASGVSMGAGPAAPALLRLERLAVSVDAWSLLRQEPVVNGLEVDGLQIHVARTADGAWSVDDLQRRFQPARPEAPARSAAAPFTVRNVAVRGGRLSLEDAQHGQRHEVTDLQFTLPWASTRPEDVEQAVQPRLSARLNGSPVNLEAQAWPLRKTPSFQGRLGVTDLSLAPLWPWLPPGVPLHPRNGQLSADISVRAEPASPQATGPWQLGLAGSASLSQMQLLHPSGDPMASWQRLAVDFQQIRPLQKQIRLGEVRLDGAQVHVRRDARGRLQWAALGQEGSSRQATAPAAASTPKPPQPSPGSTEWDVRTGPVIVEGLQIHWLDESLRPALRASVNPLNARVEALEWPARQSSAFQMEAVVQPPQGTLAGPRGGLPLALKGSVSLDEAHVAWRFGPAPLAPWQPYLRSVIQPALSGTVQASGAFDWASGDRPRLSAAVRSLRLDDFELRHAPVQTPPLAWKSLSVEGARVDLLAKRLQLGQVTWGEPAVALRRARDGALELAGFAAATPAAPAAPATAATRPAAQPPAWRLQLDRLRVAGGRLDAVDEQVPSDITPGAPWALRLRPVSLEVDRLAWPPSAAPVDLRLALQWPQTEAPTGDPVALPPRGEDSAAPAAVRLAGRVRLDNPGFQGTLQVQRWPLHRFEPHLAHLGVVLPVRVASAELWLDGRADLRLGPQGLEAAGEAAVRVADVRVLAASERPSAASVALDELATWNLLQVQGLRWQVVPGQQPRVDMGLVRLSDFFARLQVTEAGRLNLQDVTAPRPGAARPARAPAAAPSAVAPAPPVPAAPLVPGNRWPVDLSVERTEFVNGRVDFIDRFIRPNYAADLTELNGSLGRFESGSTAMAPVELRGRAARTAMLEIRGAVNPTASPLMLDLSARATDLELAPLSPYGGKYVGYAIERGKLTVDLSYRVEADGRLEGRNQIILNQLTFGERVDSPQATSLPVRLALALLADRNGVIDVNLPISGSINDPQFSVMGLVFRMIGNLLVKVVTAPFAWLAGGDTRDLSQIGFEPGAARLLPEAQQTLDPLFKALSDRPRLRMTITGVADPQREAPALRAAGLTEKLLAQMRREAARAGDAPAAAPALPPPGSQAYEALLRRLYADTPLANKPRNALGQPSALPVPQMEALLLEAVPVNEASARELALQRALAVRDALISRGLAAERLFLAAPLVGAAVDGEPKPQARMTITRP